MGRLSLKWATNHLDVHKWATNYLDVNNQGINEQQRKEGIA